MDIPIIIGRSFLPILTAGLVIMVISCSSLPADRESRCRERCYYNRADCMDTCSTNSINFTFGWNSGNIGLHSCPDRCIRIYDSCNDECSIYKEKEYPLKK